MKKVKTIPLDDVNRTVVHVYCNQAGNMETETYLKKIGLPYTKIADLIKSLERCDYVETFQDDDRIADVYEKVCKTDKGKEVFLHIEIYKQAKELIIDVDVNEIIFVN